MLRVGHSHQTLLWVRTRSLNRTYPRTLRLLLALRRFYSRGRVVGNLANVGAMRQAERPDRKSTRLNSSHGYISYAVFCLKKKKLTSHSHLSPPLNRRRDDPLRRPVQRQSTHLRTERHHPRPPSQLHLPFALATYRVKRTR